MDPNVTQTCSLQLELGEYFFFSSCFFDTNLHCLYTSIFVIYEVRDGERWKVGTMGEKGPTDARHVVWVLGEFFKNFFVFFESN